MTGFTFEGDVCLDMDECATGDNVCQPTAVCAQQHMGTDEQKYSCDRKERYYDRNPLPST